jgi:hypothetical protein
MIDETAEGTDESGRIPILNYVVAPKLLGSCS